MAKNTVTEVIQGYAGGQGTSVTIRDGRIDLVTFWTVGGSHRDTQRIESRQVPRQGTITRR